MRTIVSSWVTHLGPRDCVFTASLAIVLIAVLRARYRRAAARSALVLDAVFGLYLIFLAVVVFCPLPGLTPPPSFAGAPILVNLTVDRPGFRARGMANQNLENLLLLVPFGFGLPLVARWRGWALIAAGAILPLGIEGLQLLVSLGVGWPYRRVDLNDWIANFASALLGLALFAELSWGLSRTRSRAAGDRQHPFRPRGLVEPDREPGCPGLGHRGRAGPGGHRPSGGDLG